jgi:hypothetical protein
MGGDRRRVSVDNGLSCSSLSHPGSTHYEAQDTSSDPAHATLAAPARSTPWSAGRVIDTRGEQHPVCPPVARSDDPRDGRPHPIAQTIIAWAKNCFAGELKARPGDLSTLIQEVLDAARNDFNEESAIAWADDYTFPPEMLISDAGLRRARFLDFKAMVRRRLATLAPGRLNVSRVDKLREDNPDKALMRELAGG